MQGAPLADTSTPVVDEFPQVPGVEHRYVDAGGLRMHVAEAGEGEPVLRAPRLAAALVPVALR